MLDNSLINRMDWAWRLAFAQGATIFFLFFSLINWPLPQAGDVSPFFLLMAVYYWAIFRPTLLPPAAVFALGLSFDFLTNVPLGFNTIVLLLMQWIVKDQRLYLMGQPYMMIWLGFVVTCVLASLIQLGLYWLFHGVFPSLVSVGINTGLNILLFPLVSLVLNLPHRFLPVAHVPYKSVE